MVENHFRIRSLGLAALSLCYVAMGAIEAYHIEDISSWDVAAGQLIIEEAGGVVLDTSGKFMEFFSQKDFSILIR